MSANEMLAKGLGSPAPSKKGGTSKKVSGFPSPAAPSMGDDDSTEGGMKPPAKGKGKAKAKAMPFGKANKK